MGFGAFYEVSAFEAGSGADEGDKVVCVHGPPAGLVGLDKLLFLTALGNFAL